MSNSTNDLPQPRHRRRPSRVAAVVCAGVAVVAVVGAAAAVSLAGAKDAPPSTAVAPVAGTATAAVPSPASSSSSSAASSSASSSAAAKPAPSASASSRPATAQPVAKGGWIPVDQAAYKKQADAFKARKTDPVPAGVGDLPEFRADCKYSHRRADDPIVLPGLPGASHMHSFVGNKAVDAYTTAGDLTKFTASTCKPVVDHSAYWVPTLYDNATKKPVETTGFRVYYRSLRQNSKDIMPMPNGLRMVAGDAKKKVPTPRGAQGQFYCAFYGPGDLDGVARSTNGNWPICGEPATLHFMMQFPDCWDGKNLDSPNHKDHVKYGDEAGCPSSHPVRIPAITFDIQYGAKGTAAGYYLSSDPQGKSASSMHGDAFVMWDADAMNKRTKNCILQRKTCDNDGYYR
ncbi:DUF1996 domain-containing protein [Actinoplanes sp. LDG1-06]|uniref:DUF1996 domain-containing protein n=1 Tax=Paractinoplanes ovalisporus TaxID=2810368 RepID=A0ABS2APN2_9ACTN|nr:DUF1996 domain-containing protein [Actinoplanes ovalisporus]MBM2621806.1 DUF1996 domain-containing protein [Actinoplanes ovalisporus]